jgi:hypothetical protein
MSTRRKAASPRQCGKISILALIVFAILAVVIWKSFTPVSPPRVLSTPGNSGTAPTTIPPFNTTQLTVTKLDIIATSPSPREFASLLHQYPRQENFEISFDVEYEVSGNAELRYVWGIFPKATDGCMQPKYVRANGSGVRPIQAGSGKLHVSLDWPQFMMTDSYFAPYVYIATNDKAVGQPVFRRDLCYSSYTKPR